MKPATEGHRRRRRSFKPPTNPHESTPITEKTKNPPGVRADSPVYEVEGLPGRYVAATLADAVGLEAKHVNAAWIRAVKRGGDWATVKGPSRTIRIHLAGKYEQLKDQIRDDLAESGLGDARPRHANGTSMPLNPNRIGG